MKTIAQNLRLVLATALLGWLAVSPVAAADTATNAAAHKSPDWLRSGVVYEINTRNFSAAGDFNAVTAKLDELKDLGVNILWLMPVHPTGEKMKKGTVGSPYAVRDYYAINPAYGTTNDFKRLIDEAHKRDMKVIMDIVAGHTAWDSVLITEHPEFYQKDAAGNIIPPNPAWTDVAGLDYKNAAVRTYMIDMLKYWMRDFGVDGYRCDVVYTVPIEFWETARAELEKLNPHVIILADAGAKPALLSKAFDMDYSWNLFSALNLVMNSVSPAYLVKQSWEHTQEQFAEGALHLRFTDHHHETRAVVRYGLEGALATQVLMLTLDGVPLFYNGMEVGDSTESADPALFEKMPVFWNASGRPHLRDIYRDLIKLRKEHTAFTAGEVVWLENTASGEVISLLRRDAKDEYLVLINLSSRPVTGSVELPSADGYESVKINGRGKLVETVLPEYSLTGYGWNIYHRAAAPPAPK